jgi:ketosteroid isomerase-like protein
MLKKLLFSAILVSAFGSMAAAQDKTPPSTTATKRPAAVAAAPSPDAKAVRAVFDRLVKGIEESDVEAVTGVYQNSPSTLYFNNNGSVTRGWEQDKQNRESRYPKITNAKLNTRNVRVEMLGTGGALVTCEWTQTNDFDGKPETSSGRMSLVFKKIGKDWKIVHLHTSPDLPPANRPIAPSERTTVQ